MAWHSRYHAHEAGEFEVHYFLEGAGSFLNHRVTYTIRPELLFLTGPHEFHSIIPDSEHVRKQPISYYAILFSVDPGEGDIQPFLDRALREERNPVSLGVKYHFMFETIRELWGGISEHQRKAALHQFLGFLYMIYGGSKEPSVSSSRGTWMHVQNALEIMRRKVHTRITVEEIAQKLGISKEHLIRLFQQHLRISPLQYATQLRIEAASGYLIGTNRRICDIATLFGFENQFHFSRVFKKCTGLSPSQYRKYYVQRVDMVPPQPVGSKVIGARVVRSEP